MNIMASSKAMMAAARATHSREVAEVATSGTGCTTPEPLPPLVDPIRGHINGAKIGG